MDIELHNASRRGDDKRIVQVLNTGRVHVDSIDEVCANATDWIFKKTECGLPSLVNNPL